MNRETLDMVANLMIPTMRMINMTGGASDKADVMNSVYIGQMTGMTMMARYFGVDVEYLSDDGKFTMLVLNGHAMYEV